MRQLQANINLPNTWRFLVHLFDYQGHIRRFSKRPAVDAVFVSNMRDETDVKNYLCNIFPPEGHFNGPLYYLNKTIGRTRSINSITEELLSSKGRKEAKDRFISATRWAEKNGAKVVLLAASTKRLFGEDGGTLKELFPNMLFTIGDNGTMHLLTTETLQALQKSGLTPQNSRIAVLAPYGLLGSFITKSLVAQGFNIIGAGNNILGLQNMAKQYNIEICQEFSEMGTVDAVIACTHSNKIRLNFENIELIRKKDRKLLVVDVAEPSNLTKEEHGKCNGNVVRQDAGNAYSPNLKYVLGAVSYKMFRLSQGVTFGCFAETLSLASALNRGEHHIKERDWFTVSNDNMAVVESLFQKEGFTVPSPRCFGKEVRSFDLSIQ